jgi:hypothetical protein
MIRGKKRGVAGFTGLLLVLFSLILPALSAEEFKFVSFYDYYGGIEPSSGYENLRTRFFMAPSFSGYNDSLDFEWLLSARLWVQPLGEPYSIDPWDILHETYLFFPFDNFDFSIGQKIVAYGFADVMGPLNVLHSANRTPLSLDEYFDSRRPDPLLQVRFYPTFEDTIELTYVPVTRPDRERPGPVELPGSGHRVIWNDEPYLLDNLHSLFLHYSRYGEKADLQLFYGWYTDQTPDFEVVDLDSGVERDIHTVYNRKHTFGFAYATRAGNSTLSQDIAFNLTKDIEGTDIGGQNSDITVNTQLLVNLPGGILSQYSLVYSWFINHGKHDPGSNPEEAAYLSEEIQNFHTQPLEHIAYIIAHFERSFLREKLKTELNLGFFFSPKLYIAPRLAYALTDHWAFAAGADINLGEPPEFDLRRNPWNDNFYLRLLYRY